MKAMPNKKPKNLIKLGDIYQLGEHRLLCGSATDIESVQKLIGKEKIAAIICDPPYGVSYTESKANFGSVQVNKNILNDNITSEFDYTVFTKDWLSPAVKHLTRKNSIYIFNGDTMLFALREGMKQVGINFSQLLIWVKNHVVVGRKDYLPMHELIAYGWYGTHEFKRSKDKSVLFYPKPHSSPLHPTQKPVGLIRKIILNSTKTGDIIYDPFGGSGTTLIASEQTQRKCLMVEFDLEYCQTIILRFEKMSGKVSKKLTG